MKSIALTGGKTAKSIYKVWSNSNKFKKLSKINFFLTDERCVSMKSQMSNAGMIMNTLFTKGIPLRCKFNPPIKNQFNISNQVLKYEKKLPSKIDIIILSIGNDGHIASIFPGNEIDFENEKLFIETTSKSTLKSKKRVTLTYKAILSAKKIFILAITERKKNILEQVKSKKNQYKKYPVKNIIHGTWILEKNIKKAAKTLLNQIISEIKYNK